MPETSFTQRCSNGTPPFRSQLRVADTVIHYFRLGSGSHTVVVLSATHDSRAMDPESNDDITHPATRLALDVAAEMRVLVPCCEGVHEDVTGWVTSFLDGIGICNAALVVYGELVPLGWHLAAADPERIARILLLADTDSEGWNVEIPGHEPGGVPTLVLNSADPAFSARARRFLTLSER